MKAISPQIGNFDVWKIAKIANFGLLAILPLYYFYCGISILNIEYLHNIIKGHKHAQIDDWTQWHHQKITFQKGEKSWFWTDFRFLLFLTHFYLSYQLLSYTVASATKFPFRRHPVLLCSYSIYSTLAK